MSEPNDSPESGIVSSGWLASRFGDPSVHIIDCSWYMPQENRDAAAEFQRAHIPGAQFFDWTRASGARSTETRLLLPEPSRAQDVLAEMGIAETHIAVVYDHEGCHSIAARAWWMFRVWGHERVFVLDGGLKTWNGEARPTQSGPPPLPEPATRPLTSQRADLSAEYEFVRSHHQAPGVQIVDVRSRERYLGQLGSERKLGHIPGAVNCPYQGLIDKSSGRLRSPAEILGCAREAGIDLGKRIVAHCGGGGTSPVFALALFVAARKEVMLYNGAWEDWISHVDAPVAVGPFS